MFEHEGVELASRSSVILTDLDDCDLTTITVQ